MFLLIPLGTIRFDVAGPSLQAEAGLGWLIVIFINLAIIAIETVVLWQLKWAPFKRSLLGAFVMNLATTIVGAGQVVLFSSLLGYMALLTDFALSVLIEGLVLMLFDRRSTRKNWVAALIANIASYLLIILPLYLFYGLLG
jgi:hypothetical protein